MSAQNHAEIAKKVWPDAEISTDKMNGNLWVGRHFFNLLETDSNGQPTQQARASALDVLVWMQKNNNAGLLDVSFDFWNGNPCAAIYRAACEVLGLEVE